MTYPLDWCACSPTRCDVHWHQFLGWSPSSPEHCVEQCPPSWLTKGQDPMWQINWGEPYCPPTVTHHRWYFHSGGISRKNLRFAIGLILFFTYIQTLGLSQLGLIIEPPLHLRPLIFPLESHGSWIRATLMLSPSSFLHISAEAALLWCKLICTTLMISIIGA